MITKEKARQITEQHLQIKQRDFVALGTVDRIFHDENRKILYGKRKNENTNMIVVPYTAAWGVEHRIMFVYLEASTGQVLYTLSPHGCIEEVE